MTTLERMKAATAKRNSIMAYIYCNISELVSEEFYDWLVRNWDYKAEMRIDEVLRCYYDGEELAEEEEEEALG